MSKENVISILKAIGYFITALIAGFGGSQL